MRIRSDRGSMGRHFDHAGDHQRARDLSWNCGHPVQGQTVSADEGSHAAGGVLLSGSMCCSCSYILFSPFMSFLFFKNEIKNSRGKIKNPPTNFSFFACSFRLLSRCLFLCAFCCYVLNVHPDTLLDDTRIRRAHLHRNLCAGIYRCIPDALLADPNPRTNLDGTTSPCG